MLLKLPIIILSSNSFYFKGAMRQPIQVHDFTGCEIISSNSFYFNQLFPKFIPSIKHPTISLIYITMVKLQYILLKMKSKKDLWFSQLAKGIFSELRCYGYK